MSSRDARPDHEARGRPHESEGSLWGRLPNNHLEFTTNGVARMTLIRLQALERRGIHVTGLRGEFNKKGELVRVTAPGGVDSWARVARESAVTFEARVVAEIMTSRSGGPPLFKLWSSEDAQV